MFCVIAVRASPVPPLAYGHHKCHLFLCFVSLYCFFKCGSACPTFSVQSSQMPRVHLFYVIAVVVSPVPPLTYSHHKCHLFFCFVLLYCLQVWHCLFHLQCTVITNATCSFVLCYCSRGVTCPTFSVQSSQMPPVNLKKKIVTAFMASNVMPSLQQTVITNVTCLFAFL